MLKEVKRELTMEREKSNGFPANNKPRHLMGYKSGVYKYGRNAKALLIGGVLLTAILPAEGAAQSAFTSQSIQGSAPYLTFDNGVTKATDTSSLLSIKLPNGTSYSKNNNPSSPSNAIELPVTGQTIADVQMLVPTTASSVNLNTLIGPPYNYWRDANGDGQGENGINATGVLSFQMKDSDGNTLNRSSNLDICLAYYSVTLSSTAGTLTTKYGNPNSTTYDAATVTYYIKPKQPVLPIVCYAQPNLQLNGDRGDSFDGPASQWNRNKGFKLQNINSPSSNFPTMGANNLFFNLTIAGGRWDTVSYDKSPTNSGIDLSITNGKSINIAKITLKGPKYGDSSDTANKAVPTTFTIYSDTGKTNKIYSFTISKWFITKPGNGGGYNDNYCRDTYGGSYQIPSIADYTNSNYGSYWTGGLSGQGANYQRRIGGGLMAEWGNVNKGMFSIYFDTDFDGSNYWARESNGSIQFEVSAYTGFITGDNRPDVNVRLVCVK